MKKILIILAAVSLVAATTQTVQARDNVLSAVGGFIGGVIVGSHLERSHHRAPPPVRYAPPPPHYGGGPRVIIQTPARHAPPPRGHWENVSVKTWVPGSWIVSRDRYGRSVRHYEPGHYAYVTERVWVEHGRGRYAGGPSPSHRRY